MFGPPLSSRLNGWNGWIWYSHGVQRMNPPVFGYPSVFIKHGTTTRSDFSILGTKSSTEIRVSQSLHPSDSGDPLTFPQEPTG